MAWAVNHAYRDHVRSVDWHGRAGSILLESSASTRDKHSTSIYNIGLHGAHGDALTESLTDAVTLIKRKPRRSQFLVCADWNIDLLPTLQHDPWCNLPQRSKHHRDRRLILESFCDSLHLWTVIPARVESPCGGPFGEHSLSVPLTRIPTGENADCTLPSTLDYFAVKEDIIEDSWIDWMSGVGDHGLIAAAVKGNARSFRPQRGHWHCKDWFTCLQWMQQHGGIAKSFLDASSCTAFFLNAQDCLADERSNSQRRRDRVPAHIRSVLVQAATCSDEHRRQSLKHHAGNLFRAHREAIQTERAKYIVRTGRVFQKSKKLLQIEKLQLRDGSSSASCHDWPEPLGSFYKEKWGAKQLQLRSNVLDFIAKTEDLRFDIEWEALVRALDSISRSAARDRCGVSVLILRAFVFGHPTAAIELFQNLFKRSSFMQSFVIEGTIYGKESKCSPVDKTRAILPLPAILTVADALIAMKMNELVDKCCPPPAGIMFGARKGTQVLDVAHAAQLHLQKAGDNMGIGGLAQGDISTYYDTINCLRISLWMLRNGLDIFWVSCFLRLQLLPQIQLTAGASCHFTIFSRCLGTLTGSRSAVAAGRIPVESVVCSLASTWRPLGVMTNSSVVLFATWVDNYFAFGNSLHNAIHIAESFEDALQQAWGLSIKRSSRSTMCPQVPVDEWDMAKWPRCEQADVLGHLVSSDCSPWPCARRTEKSMWAAYWKNCVGPNLRDLSLRDRCCLLDRSVRPILFFRNTRWPFTISLADHQNKLQRLMLSHFFKLERWPVEDLDAYHRRRMRAIASVARQHGTWGSQYAKRLLNWAEHLRRPRNKLSLAAQLFVWRDGDWLQSRRRDPLVGGASRPGTRSSSGPVHRRWDESLEHAAEYLT